MIQNRGNRKKKGGIFDENWVTRNSDALGTQSTRHAVARHWVPRHIG